LAGQLIGFLTTYLASYSLEISSGLLLLLWAVLFICYPVMILKPVNKELQYFLEFLSGLENWDEANEARLEKYITNTRDKSFLQPIWKDYMENHSVQPAWDEYFNEHSLIEVPAKKSHILSIPSFLITIGLALSFFCFILQFAGVQPGSDLSQVLYPAIVEVTVVALFAILLSYLFNRIIHSMFNKAEASVYEINRMLRRKLSFDQDDLQLNHITSALDNMSSSLSNYAQYSADMQRNGMNQLVDIFLEELHSKMNHQLLELGESFRELSISQKESLSLAEAYIDELSKGVGNQKQINEVSETIISSIAQYHEQLSSCSLSLSSSFENLNLLSQTLNDVVTINKDILDNIKEERQSLKEEYGESIQEIFDLIHKYQKDVSHEVERSLEKFSDVSEKMFSRLEGSVFKSIDTWTSSNKTVLHEMEERSKNLNSVSTEISLRLSELNGSLKETMKEFTQAMERGTEKTIAEFDGGLAEITQRLSQTIAEIRDSIDDLPVIIDSMGKRLR
jgi:hypothetical protein